MRTTAYNAANELTQWGTANLSYDANGNMASRISSGLPRKLLEVAAEVLNHRAACRIAANSTVILNSQIQCASHHRRRWCHPSPAIGILLGTR